MNRLVFFVLAIVLIFMIVIVGKKSVDFFKQEDEFIKREIRGILLNVKDQKRGDYELVINDFKTDTIVQYSLSIGKFVKENNIQAEDSISKDSNSHTVIFYRKRNGSYVKISELYYY